MDRSDPDALVYLSLGSNQGHSRRLLEEAVRALGDLPHTRVIARSGLYRTAPVGRVDQPDFLNQVIGLRTTLAPHDLLDVTQGLERAAGREPGLRWGPRTLDIDLLWYDGQRVDSERLQLPHPRLAERRFVLEPLAELAPGLVLADGATVAEALKKTTDQAVERCDATEV
ncbi:MAG: 2-amino-4-hydroxy-6-hydroxymethyldihydropteridine diphosphokinase [Thermoleophilia bacterium]|nr:2-amino-4-hydroxy-6-hydroxymethyldihydropteridine diphosphokinase [Thermoleophilia bacterium]